MRSRSTPSRASKLHLLTVLLCGCLLSLPALAMGNPGGKKHDYKRQIEQLEDQWRVAQLTNDTSVMDRLLSDDYIGISMTGQVLTKAQQLDRVRTHSIMLSKMDLSDRKVKLIGSIAIVTSRADVEGSNENQPVAGMFRYTRVYQRLPNGIWKITSFEATRARDFGPHHHGQNHPLPLSPESARESNPITAP